MNTILIVHDATVKSDQHSVGIGQFIELAARVLNKINATLMHPVALPQLRLKLVQFSSGALAAELSPDVRACFLFGHASTEQTSPADLSAFQAFVEQRAGRCFATGDHARLGSNLSGSLHILSQLRDWNSPDVNTNESLDTRVRPSNPELDPHPKPVFPHWGWAEERRVHPLADYLPGLPIVFLPDHAHEGRLPPAPDLDAHWSIFDVAHAVVRTPGTNYRPELMPIVRIAKSSRGARLIVDSTIHHWLNESWHALSGTAYLSHAHAYAENVLLQLLPDEYQEHLADRALKLAFSNARFREDLRETAKFGAAVSDFIAQDDRLCWLALRETLRPPALNLQSDFTFTAQSKKIDLMLPSEPRSFEQNLATKLIQLQATGAY